jgi:hypothetical protein
MRGFSLKIHASLTPMPEAVFFRQVLAHHLQDQVVYGLSRAGAQFM